MTPRELFLALWNEHLADDIAEELTCSEVESLAAIFREFGREDLAGAWITTHARGDDEGDAHYIGA